MDTGTVISAILPIFGVILAGLLLRRVRILTVEADDTLFRLVVRVLIPCLIIDSIVGNPLLNEPGNLLVAPWIGFFTLVAGILLARALAPLAGLDTLPKRRTFAVATGIYNWAYLPLPICVALFGPETVGVLFVHNLGVEIGMWSVGILVLTGGTGFSALRHACNPPVLAIIAAVLLNLLGARTWTPVFVFDIVHLIGTAAIPLGLLLVGASFCDHVGAMGWRSSWRPGLAATLLRLGLLPLAFLALARWLPVSTELKQVMVVQAAMPAAVFPLVLAKHFGGDSGTALRVILVTSLLGMLTIPLWIHLGLAWVLP